jgi:FkbM family methyltransferase
MSADSPAFGHFAPTSFVGRVLARTRRCKGNWLGKRKAFFLRGLAVRALSGAPVDTEAMGAKMRLYPYNNVCEKRILFTPQYFDEAERDLIAARFSEDFVFLDIGSNIGGYTLFVAAHAGPRARILSIEPQPEIFERLIYNIRLTKFPNVKALNCAVADVEGEVTLFVAQGNKGETSMRIVNADSHSEQLRVPASTLLSIVQQESFEHVDCVKLDVEGAEDLILEPFFRDAPAHLWPKLLVMEFCHGSWSAELDDVLLECGYREIMRTRCNAIYERA